MVLTLDIQTPAEKVFRPQNFTENTKNLRRYGSWMPKKGIGRKHVLGVQWYSPHGFLVKLWACQNYQTSNLVRCEMFLEPFAGMGGQEM